MRVTLLAKPYTTLTLTIKDTFNEAVMERLVRDKLKKKQYREFVRKSGGKWQVMRSER